MEDIRKSSKECTPGWEEYIHDREEAARELLLLDNRLRGIGYELTKKTRILEIGSGRGIFTDYLLGQGYDVVGIDARPRGDTTNVVVSANAENLPFDDMDQQQRFDLIVGFAILDPTVYHQDIKQMLKEIDRVLETDGYVYVSSLHIDDRELEEALPDGLTVCNNDTSFKILQKQ